MIRKYDARMNRLEKHGQAVRAIAEGRYRQWVELGDDGETRFERMADNGVWVKCRREDVPPGYFENTTIKMVWL